MSVRRTSLAWGTLRRSSQCGPTSHSRLTWQVCCRRLYSVNLEVSRRCWISSFLCRFSLHWSQSSSLWSLPVSVYTESSQDMPEPCSPDRYAVTQLNCTYTNTCFIVCLCSLKFKFTNLRKALLMPCATGTGRIYPQTIIYWKCMSNVYSVRTIIGTFTWL